MVRERHRVFVKSGVTADVTEEILQRHFSSYGSVTDVYIPKVMPAQTPKGFAYISFDSEDSVHRALESESHEIDGKHFPVGRAEPRPSERGVWHREDQHRARGGFEPFVPWGGARPPGPPMHGPPPPGGPPGPPVPLESRPVGIPGLDVAGEAPNYPDVAPYSEVEPYGWMGGPGPGPGGPGGFPTRRNACRLFVGGLPDVLSEEDLKVHFERLYFDLHSLSGADEVSGEWWQLVIAIHDVGDGLTLYGKVEDVYFPKEKETRKRRGFCYVRFDSPKAADTAAARSPRTIGGHEIGEIKIAQPRPGEGGAVEFATERDRYGPGGYGPHRLGPPYNPRAFDGRPPVRFRPY